MADELKLDVIVDDHGGVKVLEDVDKGVEKVIQRAQSGKTTLDELGKSFGVNTINLKEFSGGAVAAEAGLTALGITAGVGAGALMLLAGGLKESVIAAKALHEAADFLGGDAALFSRVAQAAQDLSLNQQQVVGVMDRLSDRIGSGKINNELRLLGLELEHIKAADPSDQLRAVAAAVGDIEAPAERAHARLKLLGEDSPEAARLMTQSFRQAADDATGMSHEAIAAFNAIGEAWDQLKTRLSQAPQRTFGAGFDAFLQLRRSLGTSPDAPPTVPDAPHVAGPAGPAAPNIDRDEALMRSLELQKQQEETWYRIDDVMRNIAQAQDLITKRGGDWSDVLNNRVSTAVDRINQKLVNAVMLNSQLMGNANANRDALMRELTATTNPNESAYDKRFNEIDQAAKTKLAGVDQTDRVSAAAAENAILEEMNLEVLQLQQQWEKTGTVVDEHKKKIDSLGQSYKSALSPAAGAQLPGGLVMPTADQIAGGRYYGPVDANGRPDPARMGGAGPVPNIINVNAQNSINTNGFDELVRRIEEGLSELDQKRGARVG